MVVVGLLCLFVALGTVAFRAQIPSDGARLQSGALAYNQSGLTVVPYQQHEDGLQDGDVVWTVDGVNTSALIRALFQPGQPRPLRLLGQEVTYQVLRNDEPVELVVTLRGLPLGVILLEQWGLFLFAFVSQVLAVIVLWRRPYDPAARALFLWAMLGSNIYVSFFYMTLGDIVTRTGFWLARVVSFSLGLFYYAAVLHIGLVFPKPLPIVLRRRWLIPGLYVASHLMFLLALGWLSLQADNLIDWTGTWLSAFYLVAVVFLLATIPVVMLQYRGSQSGSERNKIRWAMFGGLVSIGVGLAVGVLSPLFLGRQLLSLNLYGLLLLAFPVSLALAIWRHHLFDIQVVVRRTLIYGVLTALLTSVYVLIVVMLGRAFEALTGGNSQLAVVVATLVIAALFSPLRRGVQDLIDRRFYRRRYDAEQALAAFAETARNETDLRRLTEKLEALVRETMEPTHVSVWLRPMDQRRQEPDFGRRPRLQTGISVKVPPNADKALER